MVTARDRAFEIVYEFSGRRVPPDHFKLVLEDSGAAEEWALERLQDEVDDLRRLLEIVERGIEADRREAAAGSFTVP